MKKRRFKKSIRRILERYRRLPADLRSPRVGQRSRAQRLLTLTICIPVMLWCLIYVLNWEYTRKSIEQDNLSYSQLYAPPTDTPAPSPTSTLVPTQSPTPAPTPTNSPTPEPTAAPTAEPSPAAVQAETDAPAPSASAAIIETATPEPSASPEPSPTPSPSPTAVPTPEPTESPADPTPEPLATPDADTIVMALETPPPTQKAFADLLALNPDTVGFVRIGDFMSLPVVQRPYDNEYYLNHNFAGEESIAGTLFLDGSNLLVPEDPSLIVYGHNMRNGTMFHSLLQYEDPAFLKEHPVIRFDTIYQNRNYVPFAVFTVTAEPESSRYLDIRRFMFDEDSWYEFIAQMRSLSEHYIPVDVRYGDNILLMVTCEYTHNNGRFVIALRAQREGENIEVLKSTIRSIH